MVNFRSWTPIAVSHSGLKFQKEEDLESSSFTPVVIVVVYPFLVVSRLVDLVFGEGCSDCRGVSTLLGTFTWENKEGPPSFPLLLWYLSVSMPRGRWSSCNRFVSFLFVVVWWRRLPRPHGPFVVVSSSSGRDSCPSTSPTTLSDSDRPACDDIGTTRGRTSCPLEGYYNLIRSLFVPIVTKSRRLFCLPLSRLGSWVSVSMTWPPTGRRV